MPVEDYLNLDAWPIRDMYENLLEISSYGGLPQDTESRPFFFWKPHMKAIGYSDADIDGLPAKVQSGEYTLANVITDAKKMQDQGVVQPGYGFYPRPANGPIYQSMLRRLYQLGFEYRRLGSAAVGLVRAANGVADLYYEAHLNAWDVLAGALIASEAGARIWMPPLERMLAEGGAVAACAPALAGYLGFLSADTAASAPEIAQSA